MPRKDRGPDQLRPVTLAANFTEHAEGSVLCSFGRTRVLCTATAEERVPSHVKGSGRGWITAEYGMLPRSTHTRPDLDYEEDFAAEVDMNVVGNAVGELLEVQGTAEKRPFTPAQLVAMVALAQKGLAELHAKQLASIAGAFAK